MNTSSDPNAATVSATARWLSEKSVASPIVTATRSPKVEPRAAALEGSISRTPMSAPASTERSTMAWPRPEPAPVTSTVWCSSQPMSEEVRQVARQQHRLLDVDRALHDLEAGGDAAEPVVAGPDPRVLLRPQPGAVQVEVRVDLELVAVVGDDPDVRDEVTGPRRRVFRPGAARLQLRDTPGEQHLGVVEPRHLAPPGELAVEVAAHAGAADGHEVVGVVGEQVEPRRVVVGVEKRGFGVEELLDLVLADHRGDPLGGDLADLGLGFGRRHSRSPGLVASARSSQSRAFIHCAQAW